MPSRATRRSTRARPVEDISEPDIAENADESPAVYFSDEENLSSEGTNEEVYHESTPGLRKRAQDILRANAGPVMGPLFEKICAATDPSALGHGDPSIEELVELMFNCAGATTTLFTGEELQAEAPTTILDNVCVRADEAKIAITHVSPLQSCLIRELGKIRQLQLEELKKENQTYQNHGLARLNDDPMTGASFAEFVKEHDKTSKDDLQLYSLCMSGRFRKFERLRDNLSDFLVRYFQTIHMSELTTKTLSPIQEWLLALTDSKVRPFRFAGVFWTSRVGMALVKRLDGLRRDLQICSDQYGVDQTTDKKRLTQIKEILRTVNHLVKVVQDVIIPTLRNRSNDVSWLIQYEAVVGMSEIVQILPVQSLLGNDKTFIDDFWRVACQHEINDLRLLAVQSVPIVFDSLLDALKHSTKQDRAFAFEIPDRVMLADSAVHTLVRRLHTRAPDLPDHAIRLEQLFETVFSHVVKHVQDADIRVALHAADRLSVMARFDSEFRSQFDVSLSDVSVDPAVSLLVHCDCPLVRHEVAKFVNKMIFTHNIVNEATVRAMLAGEEGVIDRSRVMEQSLELRTFVSFFKEYASGPTWQSRNVNTIRAFWPLAPILHQWDLLVDHLNVAFGSKPVMTVDGSGITDILGDSMWVDEGSLGALLTLMLGILECQRSTVCGSARYSSPPKFQPYNQGIVAHLDTERVLAELIQGGFRLSGGPEDALWDFSDAGAEYRPFLKRLARNLMAMWKCIGQVIVGCRVSTRYLLMALSIAYELVDATSALTTHLAVVRSDLNFSDLITLSRNLAETCQTLVRSQRDRSVLKSVFAVLRKLRNQFRQVGDVAFGISDNPLETFLKYLTDQRDKIDQFFNVMRKNTLELISGQVREIMNSAPEDMNPIRENMITLRGHLHLMATLAENDHTNTFRHGLDTLDDLMNIIERKYNYLCTPGQEADLEPSNLITVLIFDVLWLALAQWLEQIDQRFGAFILHDIRAFIGEPICDADAVDGTRGGKMEERLRMFKEDLEIFKEFQGQILSFAANCCNKFRSRAMSTTTEMSHPDRKSDLISAMACVSVVVNTSHFHATSSLWLRIERELMRLQRSPMRVTLSEPTLELVDTLVDLCRACEGPTNVQLASEVAVFADDLRLISRSHRPTAHTALENDFPLPSLTLGLWHLNDETPDSLPVPFRHCNLHQLYRSVHSEAALDSLCSSLPSLPELAYTFHVQLMASVCQLADVEFWRHGMLGPVILHGLSSKSFVSQAMGIAFLDRLRSVEKARMLEINNLARQMGDSQEAITFLDQAVQPMILTELLLATVTAAVDNQVRTHRHRSDPQAPSSAQLGNAERICERAGAALHPEYFAELNDRLFETFVHQVIELVSPERAPEAHCLLLKAIGTHLLKGKVRRRWKKEVCLDSLQRACDAGQKAMASIRANPIETKLLRLVETGLRRFIAVCHPACKVPRLISGVPSPAGLARRARRKRKDSDATSSEDTTNEDLLTSDCHSSDD